MLLCGDCRFESNGYKKGLLQSNAIKNLVRVLLHNLVRLKRYAVEWLKHAIGNFV